VAAFGQSAREISDHCLCAAGLFAMFSDGTYKWRDLDAQTPSMRARKIRGRRSPSLGELLAE
jgi:hypothetical protein